MPDYLTVECKECEHEIFVEFREDIDKPIKIIIDECGDCGFARGEGNYDSDYGYEDGYEDGHVDGCRETKEEYEKKISEVKKDA